MSTETEDTPAIVPKAVHDAVLKVMESIPDHLKNDAKNAHERYNYVSIDGFLSALRPMCLTAGLTILQAERAYDIIEVSGKGYDWLRVTYDFTLAAGGESYGPLPRSVVVMCKGAQAFGSAQSYALKQFMRSTFMVATGDEDDPDGSAPPSDYGSAARPRQQQPQQRPVASRSNGHASAPITANQRGEIMKLCRGLKISDDDRHLMTLGAFGCESSSGLTATQASETIDVLVAAKSSDEFDVINSAIARGRSGQPAKQTTG